MSIVSLRVQADRARAKWRTASSKFTSWCIDNGYGNVRWNDLVRVIAAVPEGADLLNAERAALVTLDAIERHAVNERKAWRDDREHVTFYSADDLRRFKRKPKGKW